MLMLLHTGRVCVNLWSVIVALTLEIAVKILRVLFVAGELGMATFFVRTTVSAITVS